MKLHCTLHSHPSSLGSNHCSVRSNLGRLQIVRTIKVTVKRTKHGRLALRARLSTVAARPKKTQQPHFSELSSDTFACRANKKKQSDPKKIGTVCHSSVVAVSVSEPGFVAPVAEIKVSGKKFLGTTPEQKNAVFGSTENPLCGFRSFRTIF